MEDEDFNISFPNDVYFICVLGAPRVGKSALMCRWYGGAIRNSPDEYPGCYLCDGVRRGMIVDKINCICEFFEFKNTLEPTNNELKALSKCNGILFMYSIDDKTSYEYINDLLNLVKKYKTNPYFSILCASKCEKLTDRQVSYEQGLELSSKMNISYMEVSAHKFINEFKILEELVRKAFELEELGQLTILHNSNTSNTRKRCIVS